MPFTRDDIIKSGLLVARLRFDVDNALDDVAAALRTGNLARIGNASNDARALAKLLSGALLELDIGAQDLADKPVRPVLVFARGEA